jgi:hypothetical protein
MHRLAIHVTILLLASSAGYGIRGCTLFNPSVTLTCLSPDDKIRVTLVERRLDIDRNFHLRLEDVKTGNVKVIFRSPDEGRPVGSERIIWSVDSTRFVLLGRHFYQADAERLSTGEQPYLMIDVFSGRTWCNAHQQSDYAGFSVDDLKRVSWFGWTPD